MPARMLIADHDPIVAESLAEYLAGEGYDVCTANDGEEAIGLVEASTTGGRDPVGVVLADAEMPRVGGVELLKRLRKSHPSVAVIVVTGFGKIETAVEVIRAGAVDYLTKPLVDDEVRVAASKAMQQHALLAENAALKSQLEDRYGLESLVGSDYRMQRIYELIEAVAHTRTTVLISGESGTGKSMVAHAIHARSDRAAGPFVTFSCGAIPETLLESELFGHRKGAFTGADRDKPGKILAANGGTLFIDEINSATPALQVKLLRVLQEKRFEPLGGTETVSVVLASNQPLDVLVQEGGFREDLYYRINVVNIMMPALRERTGDIAMLAEHFLAKYCAEVGKSRRLSEETIAALMRHDWPGNVRELENAIERAVVLSRGPMIEPGDLPETVLHRSLKTATGHGNGHDGGGIPALADGWRPTPLAEALLEPERQILRAALDANDWNRQETARQLQINRTTLYKKIKQFHLDEPN